MASELTPEVLAELRSLAMRSCPVNPITILALLDEIDRLREDNAKLRDMVNAEVESSKKLRLYFQYGLAVGRRGPRCDMDGDSAGRVIPT